MVIPVTSEAPMTSSKRPNDMNRVHCTLFHDYSTYNTCDFPLAGTLSYALKTQYERQVRDETKRVMSDTSW